MRIENLFDLRYFLAKLINKVQRDEIGVEKAKALGYLARCLMDVMETEQEQEILKRLDSLEERVGLK